jgi:hypothetical protein
MLGLRDLQMCFTAALLGGRSDALQAAIVGDGIEPGQRLDLYRNNVVEGFIKALAIGFPVIERLVGAEYFRQLASQFQRAHPSRSGDLHHVGQPFAAFLRARFEATDYAYLPDVAALEWAHQHALIAPDAIPLASDAFADIAPAHIAALKFTLHPASVLVRSDYPVTRIWFANQPGADEGEVIDLGSGAERVVVRRTFSDIEFVQLSEGEFVALETLAAGGTLGEALDAGLAADSTFDLAEALSRFVQLHLFIALRYRS